MEIQGQSLASFTWGQSDSDCRAVKIHTATSTDSSSACQTPFLPRIPPKPAEICKDLKAGLALSERRDVIRGAKRVKHSGVRSSVLVPDPWGRKREKPLSVPLLVATKRCTSEH